MCQQRMFYPCCSAGSRRSISVMMAMLTSTIYARVSHLPVPGVIGLTEDEDRREEKVIEEEACGSRRDCRDCLVATLLAMAYE